MQLFPKDVVISMEPPFGNVQHALLTSIKYIFRYAVPAGKYPFAISINSPTTGKIFSIQHCMITCSWTTNPSLDHQSTFGRSAIYLNLLDPGGWPRAQEQMMEIDHLCEKLQAIQIRFQLHHKNITALRDGLFSASAVMESRASTRLGGQLDPPTSQEATDEHRKCQTLDLR